MDDTPRRGFYAIIPADVRYDSRLKPNEKLLYAEITSLSTAYGYCWASNEWLAKLFTCGGKMVNPKTISAWIANLQKCGHITTQIVTNKGMVVGRRIYLKAALPNLPERVEQSEITYPEKNGDVSIKNGNPYPEKNGGEVIHIVSNTPIKGDVLFDRFWAAFPRKDGKKNAQAAWRKLHATPELLDQILKAIEAQTAALRWTKERRQYIPLPATWLNGERWNDEVSQPSTPHQINSAQFGQETPDINTGRRRHQIC